jgi:hypothetical protein
MKNRFKENDSFARISFIYLAFKTKSFLSNVFLVLMNNEWITGSHYNLIETLKNHWRSSEFNYLNFVSNNRHSFIQ